VQVSVEFVGPLVLCSSPSFIGLGFLHKGKNLLRKKNVFDPENVAQRKKNLEPSWTYFLTYWTFF